MLAFPDLADISLPEPADLTLLFTKKPDEVTVIRHAADHYQDQAYIETDPKGEQVEVTTSEDGQTIIPQAEAGYIYVVPVSYTHLHHAGYRQQPAAPAVYHLSENHGHLIE